MCGVIARVNFVRNENRVVTKLEVNVQRAWLLLIILATDDLSSFAVFSFLFVVAN